MFDDGFGVIIIGAMVVAVLLSLVTIGNHGPSKWEILLQKCEEQNQLTKDYKVCEKRVLDAKKKEDDDADDAALVSSTILMATVATTN